MAQIRETFGKVLAQVGRENPNIVVLDADLATSTKVQPLPKLLILLKNFPSVSLKWESVNRI